jgi:hypothetical protein
MGLKLLLSYGHDSSTDLVLWIQTRPGSRRPRTVDRHIGVKNRRRLAPPYFGWAERHRLDGRLSIAAAVGHEVKNLDDDVYSGGRASNCEIASALDQRNFVRFLGRGLGGFISPEFLAPGRQHDAPHIHDRALQTQIHR